MTNPSHPYIKLPPRSFWGKSVGKRHFADLEEVWRPMAISRFDKIATAGSCFAQHIGNNLAMRGAAFMDMEPAPAILGTINEQRRWGYGIYSSRYGNIYTSRQLVQLFDEAHGHRTPQEQVWVKDGRFYDAMRPSVDPVGHDTPDDVLALRNRHLAAVRRMFAELDVFVFTLGLTEGWEAVSDGTMFPVAPGTVAGTYEPTKYQLRNLRHLEIRNDLDNFWARLRAVNSSARMLLTVSPVPLAATATDNHVLVATTYSKSVLRGVAGEIAEDTDGIEYFPSYEIISTHPSRGMFYEPDLRNVNMFGVNYVMGHFFSGKLADEFGKSKECNNKEPDLVCDEGRLDID